MVRRVWAVVWSEAAARDLEELALFLDKEAGELVARRSLERLQFAAAKLSTRPLRGRRVPELGRVKIHLYRELIVRPWRLIYTVGAERVRVVAAIDGRRDLETVLLMRLLRTGERLHERRRKRPAKTR